MHTCTLFAALIGAASAETFVFRGITASFNSPSSWVGALTPDGTVANPAGPIFPTATTFGGGGLISAGISARRPTDVGSRLTMQPSSRISIPNGVRIDFMNPRNPRPAAPAVATYFAMTSGFNNPGSNGPGADKAAGFDYNCPLNWQVNGAQAPTIPSGSDTAVINAAGYFVSTLNQPAAAASLVLGSTTMADSATLCAASGNIIITEAGASATSVFSTGRNCQSFVFGGTSSASCGNLVSTPVNTPGATTTLYTCQDGSTSCVYSGVALSVADDGSASKPSVTVTTNADGTKTYAVEGSSDSVTVALDGSASVSASGGGGGGGGGGGIIIYVAAAAGVVILIVIFIVLRKKKSAVTPKSNQTQMGFENPLYDDTNEIDNPTYDGGENYVDLPEEDVEQAGDTGYLDVDGPEDNDVDDDGVDDEDDDDY